ncbi:MAG: hypothetical protein IJS96_05030 [Schwartzia sp.]|nr:hypothetical protein [Schwartzia sp. (in: firmicutes)]
MRTIRALGLTALLLLCTVATALAGTVTATGQGATERDALHNAMRQAIEQEVGVLIDSRTYVENYRVISDKIFTHSEGYINGYQILSQSYANAIYSVTIRANVSSDLLNTDLMSHLQKRALVSANMQDPRIGVLFINAHDRSSNPSIENLVMASLQDNGFMRIVDMNQIDASVRNRIANAVFEGDEDLVQMLQSHFNVDYLVTGLVEVASNDWSSVLEQVIPVFGGIGYSKADVTISVRMVNANTGEIAYAGSFDAHSSRSGSDAARAALRKAAKDLVKALSRGALKKAANPEQHVTILVTNNALGTMSEAYGWLSRLDGVNNIYVRSAQGGNMQIDVNYNGTAYDLAQALEREGVVIREMNSEYIRI